MAIVVDGVMTQIATYRILSGTPLEREMKEQAIRCGMRGRITRGVEPDLTVVSSAVDAFFVFFWLKPSKCAGSCIR